MINLQKGDFMNISKQLKNYRKKFNISQEELSEIIHVSRQTISNWENNKSYPDLQSLLLLSDYFKVSLDELVKGDIVNMKNQIQSNELKKLRNYSLICGALMFATVPLIEILTPYGFIFPLTFMILTLHLSIKIETIKKNKDLKTYTEILAYMNNKEVLRAPEDKRQKKALLQTLGLTLLSAFIGAFSVYIYTVFIRLL